MGVFVEEDHKRKIVELALASCKKRCSVQTGFIHLFVADPLAAHQDTIPTLENFIYAYTLFRSKLVDNIQQGKSLLERLLPFEINGNFPHYLHEYPNVFDPCHSSQFLPPLFYLLSDFSSILGDSLLERLQKLSERIVLHLKSLESLSTIAKNRLEAFLGEFNPDACVPKTPSEWADFCICCQMAKKPLIRAFAVWNANCCVYTGPSLERLQDGLEPAVTLLDLFMAEAYRVFSTRALGAEVVHIKGALIQRIEPILLEKQDPVAVLVEEKSRQCFTVYFGSSLETHSLTIEAKTGSFSITSKGLQKYEIVYTYDEVVPSEEDSIEIALYLSAHSSQAITINGQRATVFKAEETLYLTSPFLQIAATFLVDPNKGQFLGHISKANRSFQKNRKLYAAYDWKIGWRTLRREPKVEVTLEISW